MVTLISSETRLLKIVIFWSDGTFWKGEIVCFEHGALRSRFGETTNTLFVSM
jgi:hypothetical protein